jgi:hypothetical protein
VAVNGGARLLRTVAAACLVLGALTFGAPAVAAASPSVGAPTASISFLTSITFRGNAVLTADVVRTEIVIDAEGSTRSIVGEVPTSGSSGPTPLVYVLDTPGGTVLPNTDITARFRLTLADGSTVSGAAVTVHYDDTRYRWNIYAGTYVRVHYTDGGTAFGQRAAKIGDDAIRKVSALLGVTESDPIDFYVYSDRQAFYDVLGPGTRENVGGEAHPEIRTLFANISPSGVDDPWVGVVIPHELTHLVFDSAVRNPYHYPPRWLNEGLAVYESEGFTSSDRGAVRASVSAGSIMPLHALTAQFPTTADRFSLAYSESVSAVSFMIDTYGRDAMVALVRSYAGGVSDDEAFKAALHADVAGFESAWLASIGAPAPSPFGPQPAPAGPQPPGWGGAAPTPGTAPGAAATPTPSAALPATTGSGGSDGGWTAAIGLLIIAASMAIVLVTLGRRKPRPAVVTPTWPPDLPIGPASTPDTPPPPTYDAPPPGSSSGFWPPSPPPVDPATSASPGPPGSVPPSAWARPPSPPPSMDAPGEPPDPRPAAGDEQP